MQHQSPQDAQELIHQDPQGFHFGQRVFVPPLKLLVVLSERVIDLDQT